MKGMFALVVGWFLLLASWTLAGRSRAEAEPPFSRWVDARGDIRLPDGFRERWTHLGSWAVRGSDDTLTFHDVYTEPESAAHFRDHREFPDGATLVKEVRSSKAGTMTTGHASWADRPQIWFVHGQGPEATLRDESDMG